MDRLYLKSKQKEIVFFFHSICLFQSIYKEKSEIDQTISLSIYHFYPWALNHDRWSNGCEAEKRHAVVA